MFRQIIALFGMLLALVGFGYEANLNVDWKFSKLAWGHGLKAALANNLKDSKDVFAVDYDDSSWEDVSVPHAVNAQSWL